MFWDRNPGLRDHWLLSDVATEAIQPLLYVGRMVHFDAGQVIFWEGDASNRIYLLTAGSVQVSAISAAGNVLLAVASANDVLGEMGVLDGQPRSGTAMALEPTSAYVVPAEQFLELCERSPLVAMRILALLTARLRRNNGRLCELSGAWVTGSSEDLPAAGPASPNNESLAAQTPSELAETQPG